MRFGDCTQRDSSEVFICFGEFYYSQYTDYTNDYFKEISKNCYRATGPREQFSELPASTYGHNRARIAVTPGKFDYES